jgi:hypothetical protein
MEARTLGERRVGLSVESEAADGAKGCQTARRYYGLREQDPGISGTDLDCSARILGPQ